MNYYIVRAYFSPRFTEVHLKAMQEEHSSEGRLSHVSFLPEDMAERRIAHREYNIALQADGKLMCRGPVTDYRWALFIYTVESETEARSLIESDPFYKCGFFTNYEMNGWYYRV